MRRVVWLALVAVGLCGCTMYSRGERYLCFSLSEAAHRCKQPPYHHTPYPDEPRTKDDDIPL